MIAGKRPSPASSSTAEPSEISSASDSVFQFNRDVEEEEEDMANCLILLAEGHRRNSKSPAVYSPEIFACKTCDKSFPSFQALGGHRASHKKPVKRVDSPPADEGPIISVQISGRLIGDSQNSRARVHVCSICGAGFGSGQALGGHMRRHRPVTAAANGGQNRVFKKTKNLLSLDLNLPAPEDHDHNFKKVLIFSSSSLVDCQY